MSASHSSWSLLVRRGGCSLSLSVYLHFPFIVPFLISYFFISHSWFYQYPGLHDSYAGLLPDTLPSLAVGEVWHARLFCHTLDLEIHVCPEMLRVFRYIDMLTCVIYNCMRDLQLHACSEIALNWTARPTGATRCLQWRLSTKTGRWMRRHMHSVYEFSLLRQWNSLY